MKNLIMTIAAMLLSFGGLLIAAVLDCLSWARIGSHRHLLPGTPRSILETRRLGLA